MFVRLTLMDAGKLTAYSEPNLNPHRVWLDVSDAK